MEVQVKVPRPVDPQPGSHAIATAETTAATSAPPTPQQVFFAAAVCRFLNPESLYFKKMFKATARCALRRSAPLTVLAAEFDEND